MEITTVKDLRQDLFFKGFDDKEIEEILIEMGLGNKSDDYVVYSLEQIEDLKQDLFFKGFDDKEIEEILMEMELCC